MCIKRFKSHKYLSLILDHNFQKSSFLFWTPRRVKLNHIKWNGESIKQGIFCSHQKKIRELKLLLDGEKLDATTSKGLSFPSLPKVPILKQVEPRSKTFVFFSFSSLPTKHQIFTVFGHAHRVPNHPTFIPP